MAKKSHNSLEKQVPDQAKKYLTYAPERETKFQNSLF